MTPFGRSPGEFADFLNSFKGPHGRHSELVGIRRSFVLDFFHYFFAYFSILHFFTFLSQNTPQKGAKKCQPSCKSTKKHPPDLACKPYLQKATLKCENRIPFNVLSLFPKVPGTQKTSQIGPQMEPGTAICEQNGHPKKQQKPSR